ncbi:MAG: hypothetical protein ACK4JE_05460, partial [Endomicrobiia bacterium]
DADYLSLNIFSPRKGSILSKTNQIENLAILKKYQRYGNAKFYLRPKYLINRLLHLHSFYEFKNLVSIGYSLWKNILTEKM